MEDERGAGLHGGDDFELRDGDDFALEGFAYAEDRAAIEAAVEYKREAEDEESELIAYVEAEMESDDDIAPDLAEILRARFEGDPREAASA